MGFNGLVTTGLVDQGRALQRDSGRKRYQDGNRLPGAPDGSLEKGLITRKDLEVCVERVLKVLMRAE